MAAPGSEKEKRVPAYPAGHDDMPIYDPCCIEEALNPLSGFHDAIRCVKADLPVVRQAEHGGENELRAAG